MTELKPHQKRVLEERNELAGRIERLRQFIRSPAVRNVSGVELALLGAQELAMVNLLGLLEARLGLWGVTDAA